MNEKIENELRKEHYRIEDGGDGIFLIMQYEPSLQEQRAIVKMANLFYDDVQFCPSPDTHGEDAVAVLNCFYPKAIDNTLQCQKCPSKNSIVLDIGERAYYCTNCGEWQ
jgi:hypothetical protein